MLNELDDLWSDAETDEERESDRKLTEKWDAERKKEEVYESCLRLERIFLVAFGTVLQLEPLDAVSLLLANRGLTLEENELHEPQLGWIYADMAFDVTEKTNG